MESGIVMAAGFFHEMTPLPANEPERISRAARFPEDSAWFSGHFPGHPIVPGVALIALAAEAVMERARGEGRSLTIRGLRRIRFRLPVQPGDEVILEIVRMADPGETAYAFTVRLSGETACSGVLTAEEASCGDGRIRCNDRAVDSKKNLDKPVDL